MITLLVQKMILIMCCQLLLIPNMKYRISATRDMLICLKSNQYFETTRMNSWYLRWIYKVSMQSLTIYFPLLTTSHRKVYILEQFVCKRHRRPLIPTCHYCNFLDTNSFTREVNVLYPYQNFSSELPLINYMSILHLTAYCTKASTGSVNFIRLN